ncbi:MAG: hypothetical protein ABI442_07945 [Gemmatimonadaceae bacterium]
MRDRAYRSARNGSVLIEVLVAIVLLAISGTSLITLLGQTSYSMTATLATEDTVRRAGEEMDRIALASRAELLARTGRIADRGWAVEIEPMSTSLFAVSVFEPDSTNVILRTTLYRPPTDSLDASR